MKVNRQSTERNANEARPRKPSGVAAVDKALAILEAFTTSTPEHGLASLALQTELPKATVHRLLVTLTSRGYIESTEGTYRLGTRILDIANSLLASLDLRHIAHPHLISLRDQTNETVHLGITEGRETVYLDKVDSLQSVRMHTWVGRRAFTHCTAIGKAMLAHREADAIREYLNRQPLEQVTPKTVIQPSELLEELDQIRMRNYAIDDEEGTEGIRCVAAPIRDQTGQVIAAVGIAGPVTRMSLHSLPAKGASVVHTAQIISAELGYSDEWKISE